MTPRRAFNLFALGAGGVGLIALLRSLGFDDVMRTALGVGNGFALVLALAVAGIFCDAAAMHVLMRPEARMVSYWRVVAAQASGLTLNLLTPGAKLGEVTKVTLLTERAPRNRAVSTVLLFNLCYLYFQTAVVVIGVPLLNSQLTLPRSVENRIWIGLLALLALAVLIGTVVHRGIVRTVLGIAARARLVSARTRDRLTETLAVIDRHVRELHLGSTPSTRAGMGLVALAKMLTWAEISVILYSLGARPSATVLLAILVGTIIIDELSAIVPFGLGLADAGNYLLFGILGLTPVAGAALTLVRRGRNAALAALGLAVMLALTVVDHVAVARRRARIHSIRAG